MNKHEMTVASFEEVRAAYPVDKKPGSSRKAYSNAILFGRATHEQLLKAAKAAKFYFKDREKQFIPALADFIETGEYENRDLLACVAMMDRKFIEVEVPDSYNGRHRHSLRRHSGKLWVRIPEGESP